MLHSIHAKTNLTKSKEYDLSGLQINATKFLGYGLHMVFRPIFV